MTASSGHRRPTSRDSRRDEAPDAGGRRPCRSWRASISKRRCGRPSRRGRGWRTTPDESAQIVRNKERTLRELEDERGPLARWRRAADTWCSAWFWPQGEHPGPSVFNDLVASALGGQAALKPAHRRAFEDTVRGISAAHRFFHWSLEFPEVFADAEGAARFDAGFDAIVGNPPWDMLRAEDGANVASVRHLFSFVRESGLYTAGDGHVNRFHLFVERALDLLRDGGRLGFITPWGLLGDAGAAAVRRRLLERASIDAAIAFENRRAIFPIHRSVQFLVTTATRGRRTESIPLLPASADPEILDEIDDQGARAGTFPVVLTQQALKCLAPRDLACPAVRSASDLTRLVRLASTFPALADPAGWGMSFGRELNATDDRHHFVAGAPGLPVVEGKHLSPFGVDLAATTHALPASAAASMRGASGARSARVAYRDIASPGNRLTLIAAVLPAGVVSTHTVHVARRPLDADSRHVLCALLNSFVANWFVRHWVTTHVTAALVQRLPMPRPEPGSRSFQRVASLARRCAREGVDGAAYVELQVECALLYSVSRLEFADLVRSFPLVDESLRQLVLERHARACSQGQDGAGMV